MSNKTDCFENTPQISWPIRRKRNRLVQAVLFDAVRQTLPPKDLDFLYRLPPQGMIAWQRAGLTFSFQVNPYDEFAWRLTNRWIHHCRLPKRLCEQVGVEPLHDFELSFVGKELPLVATPELVRFIESVSSTEAASEVYKWPLFSHDESYPSYAWTREGGVIVERKQRERARLKAY
jgi:hypothetical protein